MTKTIVRAKNDLTLFCDIYNVFFMFLTDFFVPNLNPMSAILKSFSICIFKQNLAFMVHSITVKTNICLLSISIKLDTDLYFFISLSSGLT